MKNEIENALFSVTINPILKLLISRFDVNCPADGNLILNSLRRYLGQPVPLCSRCKRTADNIISPIYDVGARLVHSNKSFMQAQFTNQKYGEAWLRGFGLVMKGLGQYGVRLPFVPAGPVEIV